jgi:hypothetical protein
MFLRRKNIAFLSVLDLKRYSYVARRIRYGDFETDTGFFYANQRRDNMAAAFVEGTCLCCKE